MLRRSQSVLMYVAAVLGLQSQCCGLLLLNMYSGPTEAEAVTLWVVEVINNKGFVDEQKEADSHLKRDQVYTWQCLVYKH